LHSESRHSTPFGAKEHPLSARQLSGRYDVVWLSQPGGFMRSEIGNPELGGLLNNRINAGRAQTLFAAFDV
jgi:hypothetical protein